MSIPHPSESESSSELELTILFLSPSRLLASEGYSVALIARRASDLEALASSIVAAGGIVCRRRRPPLGSPTRRANPLD